jgi:glycosyltransferase involved in cell wall biosynthesis
MSALKNKTILIISPQSWGKMFVSKHHYALELAKYGNTVYFLNPPDATLKESVQVMALASTPGLFIISHRLNFPYNIKFHAIGIFHWLMRWHIKKIVKVIGKPIDIVWSFDLGNLYPFKLFPKKTLRVFHPVDEPLNATAINSAKGAQVIFSVTNEILEKYRGYGLPLHFINHGVSEIFLEQQQVPRSGDTILVGFSGNLLRPDIDRPVFLQIIKENPHIVFECWGSYQAKDDNIGGGFSNETALFIDSLRALPNVILHGAVPAAELAAGYRRMDAFLICYDVERDQSKGTNYHKVMEYLGAGKVIISNNISTYKDRPDLVSMISERLHNSSLPALFKEVTGNLALYNTPEALLKRQQFAAGNTYKMQVANIECLLNAQTLPG